MQALEWSKAHNMVTAEQYTSLQSRLLQELVPSASASASVHRERSRTPSSALRSSLSQRRSHCSDLDDRDPSGDEGSSDLDGPRKATQKNASEKNDDRELKAKRRRMKCSPSVEEKMLSYCKTIVMVEHDGKAVKREVPFKFETKEGEMVQTWTATSHGTWRCAICSSTKLPVFNPDPSAKERIHSKLEHNTYMEHTNAVVAVWKPPEGEKAIKWASNVGKQKDYIAKACEYLSTGKPIPSQLFSLPGLIFFC